jgi:chemotaxis protein histidine kinase CheA
VLQSAFVHVLRNALDHGIEAPEQRLAAGKRREGKITLSVARGAAGVRLLFWDDGRGLPLDRLRAQAENPSVSDQEIAESIFEFGVSTAAQLSSVSGRGVGMDAVRALLREHGGDVSVEFTGAPREGYRPFRLVFLLPSSAVADLDPYTQFVCAPSRSAAPHPSGSPGAR